MTSRTAKPSCAMLVQLLASHLENNAHHMARECVVCTVVRVLATAVPQFCSVLKHGGCVVTMLLCTQTWGLRCDDVALYSNMGVAL